MSAEERKRAAFAIVDFATGVKGSYCIGRKCGAFTEFWNPSGWAGSGYVFYDRQIAEALVEAWQARAALAEPRWIPVEERLPDTFGRWYFDDEVAPDDGSCATNGMPMLIHGNRKTWGRFCRDSTDHGKSIARSYWVLDDQMQESEDGSGVTHWFELPPSGGV